MESYVETKSKRFLVPDFEPCLFETVQQKKELIDGRPLSKSVIVVDDPLHRYDGMKVSDFALENLLDIGLDTNTVMFHNSKEEILRSLDSYLIKTEKTE